MKVSKEEILHIAKLADLEIKDEEIEKYFVALDRYEPIKNRKHKHPSPM